ncbi:hypothetical protein DL771_012041 [Monosporascus sp. 5C6A]|nr:hypothetical protein DL771_012041 [Monosporascus sp. 5C6A]
MIPEGLDRGPFLRHSHIPLSGEKIDDVKTYDTCDEIRRKVNEHLKTPGVTQAQFCWDLYAQLKMPKTNGIQSTFLADFRAGETSSVFYATYVYFEKKRTAEGMSKSQHRLEIEKE